MSERTCTIDGCDNPHMARGWCSKHWKRWRSTGDPLTVKRVIGDDETRFWMKVDASGDCWEWTSSRGGEGYGLFRVGGRSGSYRPAHRVAWEMLVGPIGGGLEIDHLCRNHGCVNPDHLEPVTHAENMRRAPWKAAEFQRAKTHCPKGHAYDEENTYINAGKRRCRACDRERCRRRSGSANHPGG